MWLPYHRLPRFSAQKKRKVDDSQSSFFLSEPNTRKIHRENLSFNDSIEVGHSSMQGYRVHMEDERIIDKMTELNDHVLVAIMDGTSLVPFRFISNFDCFIQVMRGHFPLISQGKI
jgi:hypothetical protein